MATNKTTTITQPWWGGSDVGTPGKGAHEMWTGAYDARFTPEGDLRDWYGPNRQATAFDPYEQMALDRLGRQALGPNLNQMYAQNQMSQLHGRQSPAAQRVLLNTLSDQYLDPTQGPGMQSVFDTIGKQVRGQLGQDMGGIAGAFGQRGTFGGSRSRDATSAAMDSAADAIASEIGNITYSDAAQRRAEQQAARADVMGYANAMDPLVASDALNYSDIDRMMRGGAYRRQTVTDPNRDIAFENAARAWDFRMNAPMDMAQLYGAINRGAGGGTQTTHTPYSPGLQKAQMGANVANAFGSIWNPPSK